MRRRLAVFSCAESDEKRQLLKKQKRVARTPAARECNSPSLQPQGKLDKTADAKIDPTLDATLFFIEGTNNNMSRREAAGRRKLEVGVTCARAALSAGAVWKGKI